jgi:hypothetical protein
MSFSGTLTPPAPGSTITIDYTPPSGAAIVHSVVDGANGGYADTLAPTMSGDWHAQSHWAGNANNLPSDSSVCAFTVS